MPLNLFKFERCVFCVITHKLFDMIQKIEHFDIIKSNPNRCLSLKTKTLYSIIVILKFSMDFSHNRHKI